MKSTKRRKVAQTTAVTIFSFFIIIFIGGFILNLPISNTRETTFLDSTFSSAAAVCVSGLTTVTIADQYTLFGKIVLLILTQIGALGFLLIMSAFYLLIKRKITYKEQLMVSATIGSDAHLENIRRLIIRVVKYTFITEAIGAIILGIRFIPMFGIKTGIFQSIFTSVSAFCNCGLDLLGGNSLKDFGTDYLVLTTVAILTILGGLGFIVCNELIERFKYKKENKVSIKKAWLMTTVHTKIVLVMTLVMIVVGTVGLTLIEYNNKATIGDYNLFDKLFVSAFQGISARTTGMTAIDLMSMSDAGKLFTAILMFIGGAPGSTAGGIKTVTLAVLVLAIISALSENKSVIAYKREIPNEIIKKSIAVLILAIFIVCTMSIILSMLNPEVEFINIMFEVISSLATCGYSLGITASLTSLSKAIIILIMYIGRVSTVTMAMALTGKKFKQSNIIQYPKADINVG